MIFRKIGSQFALLEVVCLIYTLYLSSFHFLKGGTGVAPLYQYLKFGVKEIRKTKWFCWFCFSTKSDFLLLDEFTELAESDPEGRFTFVIITFFPPPSSSDSFLRIQVTFNSTSSPSPSSESVSQGRVSFVSGRPTPALLMQVWAITGKQKGKQRYNKTETQKSF